MLDRPHDIFLERRCLEYEQGMQLESLKLRMSSKEYITTIASLLGRPNSPFSYPGTDPIFDDFCYRCRFDV